MLAYFPPSLGEGPRLDIRLVSRYSFKRSKIGGTVTGNNRNSNVSSVVFMIAKCVFSKVSLNVEIEETVEHRTYNRANLDGSTSMSLMLVLI